MRTRSFSLAKTIPAEIIDLIILQSSDSVATLRAWCLVSLSCLNAGGRLLNEHVVVKSDRQLYLVLHRLLALKDIEQDPDRANLVDPILPRLAHGLSLRHTRRLTLSAAPSGAPVAAAQRMAAVLQPRRPHLVLEFGWADRERAQEQAFQTYLAPTLIRMLRSGQVVEGTYPGSARTKRKPVIITGWPLQFYYTHLALFTPYPSTLLASPSSVSPDPPPHPAVGEMYDTILTFSHAWGAVDQISDLSLERCDNILTTLRESEDEARELKGRIEVFLEERERERREEMERLRAEEEEEEEANMGKDGASRETSELATAVMMNKANDMLTDHVGRASALSEEVDLVEARAVEKVRTKLEQMSEKLAHLQRGPAKEDDAQSSSLP